METRWSAERSVPSGNSAINGVFKGLSAVTAALVLLQAVLAAQGFWRASEFPNLLNVHGIVGNLLFLLVIAQAAIALYGTTRGGIGRNVAILNLVILGLVVLQIGLGYTGRSSATAVSWHVPNGVLLFGLAVLNATLVLTRPSAGRR